MTWPRVYKAPLDFGMASRISHLTSMVNVLVLGGTGPTGLALIEEALSRGHTVIIFARSPQKLPDSILQNPRVAIVKGSLEDEDAITRAFETRIPNDDHNGQRESAHPSEVIKVDVVVSALGPPVTKIHPAGNPLARGYEKFIHVARRKGVTRFIVLGTASITDEHDRSDLKFQSLVFGVKYFAPRAYAELVEIGKVFGKSDDLEWTIVRIPVLVSHEGGEYHAGYIGDGRTTAVLTRPLFAKFVFDECDARAWIQKRPLVSWAS
ncbi:hypothetical protein PIIN_01584 [Serendipita indica DSM 11827]|uniref:NAD(P)-binding domain-containing protein n=1 Tax=Serendipita indica (strain DSM 11827) TaxID=1109443 RepID=G4T8V7_SERID|nr:hypothetical protein PIIN_01584 [Serendipita indica DSM 11827]